MDQPTYEEKHKTPPRENSVAQVEERPVHSRESSCDGAAYTPRERWNYPRRNKFKLAAAFFGFFVSGMKDSATGVVIPHLETYYNISYFTVSLAFIAPFVGYLIAAVVNDRAHRLLGRWGITCFATSLQLTYYIIAGCKPPFIAYVIGYGISGAGSGMIEASMNTMCANLEKSHQVLGLLHGFYGIGGVVCPTFAQAMLARGLSWNHVYLVMVGCSAFSLCLQALAFSDEKPKVYRQLMDKTAASKPGYLEVLKHKLVPILAVTTFLYVSGEVGTGGWTTTYMINVRHGDFNKMGYVSTGYWIGIALGRMVLGFLTQRVGNLQLIVTIYISCAVVFSLIFWLVPSLIASAIAVALIGLAIGPLYPSMMAVAVEKLPQNLHILGVGFAAALGGGGTAAGPFLGGVLAQLVGPWAIAPLIFSFFSAMLILWIIIWRYC